MKTYILVRLKYFALGCVSFVLTLIAIERVFSEGGVLGWSAPATILLGFAPFLFTKPSWYNQLPQSRVRLIYYHFVETALMWLILAAIYLTLALFLFFRGSSSAPYEFLAAGFGFSIVCCWFRLGFISGVRRLASASDWPFSILLMSTRKQRLWRIGFLGLLAAVPVFLAVTDFANEDWFIFGICLIYLLFPYNSLFSISTPEKMRKSYFKKLAVSTSAFYTLIFLGAVYFSNNANPRSAIAVDACKYLGHLPIPMSHQRVADLFRLNDTGYLPIFRKIDDEVKSRVSLSAWEARTEKCRDASCLSFSDQFLRQDESRANLQLAMESYMRVCSLKLSYSTRSQCAGPKLRDEDLSHRLDQFVTSGLVDEWLNDAGEIHQLVAIKALAKSQLTPAQGERIRLLEKSESRIVKFAALDELNIYNVDSGDEKKTCGRKATGKCQPRQLSELF